MTPSVRDRLAGAVWGHLVGDAIGVPYEFGPPRDATDVRWGATGAHHQPPGTWSDDGGLMLALLDSLLSAGFDLEDQGRRALAWYETTAYKPGSVFDVGSTTMRALENLRNGTPAVIAGGAGEKDNGNGSLMRILPVAIVTPSMTVTEMVAQASAASCITHRHHRARVTCAVYCAAARRLLGGDHDLEAVLAGAFQDVRLAMAPEQEAELERLAAFEPRTGSGYVVDTFWSAWSAFAGSDSYQATIEKAVSLGGDTDTTACVAGGLAGLRWGLPSIPPDWLDGMRGKSIVEALVGRLLAQWGEHA